MKFSTKYFTKDNGILSIALRYVPSHSADIGRKLPSRYGTVGAEAIWKSITPINTLRPRQMDAISQTTFSNAFSWMKMFEFRLKAHWSLFPRVQLTIFQQWFRQWLGAGQATSHSLKQWWLVYRRIYASLGLNELNWNPTVWCNIIWSLLY